MLNRNEELREDADFIESARRSPATRFIVYAGAEALLKPDFPAAPLDMDGGCLAELGVDLDDSVFLGLDGQVPWFAVDLAPATDDVRASCAGVGRFEALGPIQEPIEGEAWSMLAQARALLAWNTGTRFCPRCGSPTEMRCAGYQRSCTDPACGALHFPRTDPAIIVRVTNGDRCLLARQPAFPPGLQAVLAGFAEPGETFEEAVAREVEEEVGLRVQAPAYFGSQAWPFPTSVMVAFTVETSDVDIRLDGRELESAEWYTRERIRRDLRQGSLVLPSLKSISRRLIDDWLEAP